MVRLWQSAGPYRPPLLAAGFVALACLVILVLSGWREWDARNGYLANAETDLANLARSLIQHADDTFEIADNTLTVLVNQLELEGTSAAAMAKVQTFMARRNPAQRVRGIFVYDDTGRWLATTERVADLSAFNNSDRDYFQQHKASPARGTLIGQPVHSRSGGQWIITASRRFNRPDGSFAGVALLSIDVDYFAGFYRQFDVGPQGSIALLTTSGFMLARSRDNERYVGRDMSGTRLMRELPIRPVAGVYDFTSPLDGVERLSFYRRSSRYPLMVLATEARDDVLAPWRRDAVMHMAVVVGLVALIALTGFILVLQLWQRQRMAAALEAKEADFRLLAEQSGDMVMRIGLDEEILYVSPSSARVVGWLPHQLAGMPALAGVHAEDLPHVRDQVAALKEGRAEEARVIYRTRHRIRGDIWVESALRVTRVAASGAINGVVAITRDMTEHKDLEQRLAALATRDGLTGLANRRHFDDRLAEEWARAKRDGTPLALLMIDVDHFKLFNDHYGHQGGDDCLRALARVLAAQARRPADLAARYGGEEFALLLPDTDAEGCARIGEAVRRALHELAIPHAASPSSHLVTVSIGGAMHQPSSSHADAAVLIEAADRALYAAKERGRNRLVMSGEIIAWPGSRSA
ncbi:MAG: diguanylate cyclase [Pseudomonadota bacterium]|jgi:diguanylate cyclase (GGDEF)-like protein/PAS domain S-box-containing protein